jgi:uncharacterized delta-60 repeat protein
MMRTFLAGLVVAGAVLTCVAGATAGLAGDLDTSFNFDGKVLTDISGAGSTDAGYAVAIGQNNGDILVAGTSNGHFALTDYCQDGHLSDGTDFNCFSPQFGSGGIVSTDLGQTGPNAFHAAAFDWQSGEYVAAGASSTGDIVAAFQQDGTPDWHVSNSPGGEDDAIAIQPNDGRIVVAGTVNGNMYVARYNGNGTVDGSFGSSGSTQITLCGTSYANGVAVQQDGKIVVVGTSVCTNVLTVVRLKQDGALDTTFGVGGKVTTPIGTESHASAVAIMGDGRIVVAGTATNADKDFALVRYKPNGTLDTSLGGTGVVTTDFGHDDLAQSVALDNNTIVVAGSTATTPHDFAVARYNFDGSLDTSFGTGGKVMTNLSGGDDSISGLAVDQNGGNIVAAGSGGADFGVARYLGQATNPVSVSLCQNGLTAPGSSFCGANGAGFAPYELVDLYFDTTDELLVQADGSGHFFTPHLSVPASAQPGDSHWVTAVGRTSHEAAQAQAQVGVDWPQLGLDPTHTSNNDLENTIDTTNARKLRSWAIDSDFQGTHAAPATFMPKGFVGVIARDGSFQLVGSGVFSNGPPAGQTAWSSDPLFALSANSSPAFNNFNIYAGSATNHKLEALNAFCCENWSNDFGPGGAINSSPTFVRGTCPPCNSPDALFVGSDAGQVESIDPYNNGNANWNISVGGPVRTSPAVDNGLVFVGAGGIDGHVYAFRAADGTTAWTSAQFPGAAFAGSPAVDGGGVFIAQGGTLKNLLALDEDTGTSIWPTKAGVTKGPINATPAIGDGLVWVGSTDGNLYAFDEDTGATVFKLALGAPGGSPTLANGLVYVTTPPPAASPNALGKLYVFDATTGKRLYRAVVGNDPSQPIVVDGRVFISSKRGLTIYGVGTPPPQGFVPPKPNPGSLKPDPTLRPTR